MFGEMHSFNNFISDLFVQYYHLQFGVICDRILLFLGDAQLLWMLPKEQKKIKKLEKVLDKAQNLCYNINVNKRWRPKKRKPKGRKELL